MPIEVFVSNEKGDFSGVFFASFASAPDRIKALSAVKSKLVQLGGKVIWANTDLPKENRTVESFLFGLKKQLVEWGFTRASVRAEVDDACKHF